MAAAPGTSIQDAYAATRVRRTPRVGVAEFSPAGASLRAELPARAAAIARDMKAATSGDPFAKRPGGELPADTLPKGGRKSRRKTRKGGAKAGLELLADLTRDPSKTTLENVIADLKESPQQDVVRNAETAERTLQAPLGPGESMDERVRQVIESLQLTLAMAGGRKSRRKTRKGGAMIKPLRELVRDLERDPSKSTLENVLSDLKAGDNPALVSYARVLEENLREPLRGVETMEQRVRVIIVRITGFMGRFRGGRRKTTRRR